MERSRGSERKGASGAALKGTRGPENTFTLNHMMKQHLFRPEEIPSHDI